MGRIGPTSTAVRTGLRPGDFDFYLGTKNGVFKFYGEIISKVGSSLGLIPSSPAGRTENVAESKKVTQDVAEIAKNIGVKSTESASAQAGMAETIVVGPFIRITQDTIGLSSLFEVFLRTFIPWVTVRMEFNGQFPVGTLDFLL